MERATFEERLTAAARGAVQFARTFVRQPLPDEFALLVVPKLAGCRPAAERVRL